MQNRTHNLFVSWRTSETLLSFSSLFEDELMIFAYVKLFALEKPFLESWSRLSLGNWLFNSFFHYQIILFTRGPGPMLSFLRLPTVDSPEKRNIQGDKTNGPTSSTDLAFLLQICSSGAGFAHLHKQSCFHLPQGVAIATVLQVSTVNACWR